MATLTVDEDVLLNEEELAKKEDISREDIIRRQRKVEFVKSLFGIIPDNGMSLTELREERLSRYENAVYP
ncbi:hypothetical protein R80B4_00657 [Fibrobacteres bacterium R8-0-B4]